MNKTTDIFAIPGMKELWKETDGDPDIVIAVLDGSVDLSHSCFSGAKLNQLTTLVSSDEVAQGLAAQHGTHVTSVIFGQHESEVRGIAPGCRGLIVPVYMDKPGGKLAPCSQIDLARAITQAVEAGANIINISGGQLAASGEADRLLMNAVRLCQERQVLLVAAAGNEGCDCLHVPAAMESVLAVGAMDAEGQPVFSSNWGKAYQSQGILALGENILGAEPGGGTVRRSGTSFATPIISGIAALLLSIQRQQGESPDPYAARDALLRGALSCDLPEGSEQKRCLTGRLNIPKTYNLLIRKGGFQTMSENKTMDAVEPQITEDVQPDTAMVTPSADCGCGNNTPNKAMDALDLETPNHVAEPKSVQPHAVVYPSSATAVTPSSSCGCGGGNAQMVYALGDLDVDYGSEAKRDSYLQNMGGDNLLKYLDDHPYAAQNLIWTLNLDATPIYAIVPMGAYASEAYDQLRKALAAFGEGRIERVAIPGYIGGSITLMSGQTVPTIVPEVRGMVAWTNVSICETAKCMLKEKASKKASDDNDPVQEPNNLDQRLGDYLNRIYYDYRNLGLAPQERALNFSATNAYQITEVLISAGESNLVLDQIQTEKSPICRPESDCYDVKLTFFDPENNQRARRIYRFTVDVSEAVPVTIGKVRDWAQS